MIAVPKETRLFIFFSLITIFSIGLFSNWIPQVVQLSALAIGVVALGLPHGALDPSIAERSGLIDGTQWSLIRFNTVYIIIVLGVIGLWWLAPTLSLSFFLLISAYHFSGDWKSTVPNWAQWVAGASLLLMPITFHTSEVAAIFEVLSGAGGRQLATILSSLGAAVPASLAGISLYAIWQRQWATALEWMSILALGYIAPALVFFILYFCLLHSPRHLSGHFADTPASDHSKLWRMLVTYTLATLVVLAPMVWLWSDLALDQSVLKLVFVGLAAVTVPHMALMVYAEHSALKTQC